MTDAGRIEATNCWTSRASQTPTRQLVSAVGVGATVEMVGSSVEIVGSGVGVVVGADPSKPAKVQLTSSAAEPRNTRTTGRPSRVVFI